jgi:hypothetical protein
MADALVENVATARRYAAAKKASQLMETLPSLTKVQLARLLQSVADNDQVGDAIDVPERINALASGLA